VALQEDPEQILKERDDYRDRLLRSIAEFDNYRKRIERERRELAEFVSFEILHDLLPLVDDLERALAAAPLRRRHRADRWPRIGPASS
jgi:molecular chaperone GrpE